MELKPVKIQNVGTSTDFLVVNNSKTKSFCLTYLISKSDISEWKGFLVKPSQTDFHYT